MPERERAICRRLKEFRSASGLSQAEFARISGLGLSVYASYEYERPQLNYPAAWRILKNWPRLNPVWLVGENAPRLEIKFVVYPTPAETGLGPRTAFSEVFDKLLRKIIADSRPAFGANQSNPFLIGDDANGRVAAKEAFAEIVGAWLPQIPDGHLNEFLNLIFNDGRARFSKVKQSKPKRIFEVAREMEAIENKHRLAYLGNFAAGTLKKEFDTVSILGNNVDVKAKLPALIKRLNEATKERGTKTALAKFIGVPLPKISQWLSGEHEPGGETTLRLLQWVEQQECQK